MSSTTDRNPTRRRPRRLAMALAVVAVALAVSAAQPASGRDRTLQSGKLLRVRFVQETFWTRGR
jgi:hypothetical protein